MREWVWLGIVGMVSNGTCVIKTTKICVKMITSKIIIIIIIIIQL